MAEQRIDYQTYWESLKNTPGPIMPSQLPKIKMDLTGLSRYASEKGVAILDLSAEEMSRFVPADLLAQTLNH